MHFVYWKLFVWIIRGVSAQLCRRSSTGFQIALYEGSKSKRSTLYSMLYPFLMFMLSYPEKWKVKKVNTDCMMINVILWVILLFR